MKHIKIAFVLLAAIFVSLSSFKSTGKANGPVKDFVFEGTPGSQEYDAQYWNEEELMGCGGEESQICGITIVSDALGQHPDQTTLSALLAEAATEDPEIFKLVPESTNGVVYVFE